MEFLAGLDDWWFFSSNNHSKIFGTQMKCLIFSSFYGTKCLPSFTYGEEACLALRFRNDKWNYGNKCEPENYPSVRLRCIISMSFWVLYFLSSTSSGSALRLLVCLQYLQLTENQKPFYNYCASLRQYYLAALVALLAPVSLALTEFPWNKANSVLHFLHKETQVHDCTHQMFRGEPYVP